MHVAWLDISATKGLSKRHSDTDSYLRLEYPIKAIVRRDVPNPIGSQVVETNIAWLESESERTEVAFFPKN